jgi:group II intron reverse transcriptase/maturase
MKAIDRLSVIRYLSENKKGYIHKNLFRILRKEDIWIAAYENIKSNKGALTPGSTKETMDGMSLEKLHRLRESVVTERYRFKPVKEIEIPKPDGRKRPLGLPTASDKIVQEVIRMILETIYEPCFRKESFGFRRGMGTHDALKHIESKFRWIDWVIKGDIKSAYPTIDHNRLCEILDKKIQDGRFMNLIRKLLKCGILRAKHQFTRSSLGIPQGSIVSPILANIYYHELDEWVKGKAAMLDQEPSSQRSKEYKHLSYEISKIHKKLQKFDKKSDEYKSLLQDLKSKKRERMKVPSLANKRIRIEYVRYADDWMIGVSGEKSLANKLKTEVGDFMEVELKQSLHPVKTKLTNIRAGKVKFLGYEIYLPRNRNISPYTGSGTRTTRRTNPMVRFDLPLDAVLKRIYERGYIGKLPQGYFPTSKKDYTTLQDIIIVKHFQMVWKGIENYYSGCTNLNKLQYIHYLFHMSCAMTLAHRHRSSSRKMFAKHGKNLTISEGKTRVSFPIRKTWSIEDRRWLIRRKFKDPFKIFANRVSRSSLGRKCLICHSKGTTEMHHVKHIRKNGVRYRGFQKEMALLNRKQVPLCRECHMKVHDGLYDSIRLKDLIET